MGKRETWNAVMEADITFNIRTWTGWMPENPLLTAGTSSRIKRSQTPDASSVPAMLRRRLNPLGRACVSVTKDIADNRHEGALVYCSRHGDLERSLTVLQEVASKSPVSPMQFSLSVHNAITGILSIHNQFTGCISSIAFGEEGLTPTLLEAAGLLADHPEVVCILSDVPPPDIYRKPNYGPNVPYAACFVLSRGDDLSFSTSCKPAPPPTTLPQGMALLIFLENDCPNLAIPHNGSQWVLTRT
jgi:hypothetical protein